VEELNRIVPIDVDVILGRRWCEAEELLELVFLLADIREGASGKAGFPKASFPNGCSSVEDDSEVIPAQVGHIASRKELDTLW
jgi:hypothetical protein